MTPTIKSICINCGEITTRTRCEKCERANNNMRIRTHSKKASAKARGYDSRWKKLSLLARKLQPFCGNCGATTDLQCDHTPEAWDRFEQGLEIRLCDVQVLCGECNRKAGAARGEDSRRHKATNLPRTVKAPNHNNPAYMGF